MTGYPQVGGGGLHIAHVLIGGVFMLVAMILLLAFLNRSPKYLAAMLGGFGFGAFIDELGKFITSDNNYFFQPTVGLIYITFILLYLAVHAINRRSWLSEEERLINVLEIAKEAVLKDLDMNEKQQAIDLLEESDPSDAVVKAMKELLHTVESKPVPRPDLYSRIKEQARRLYQMLVKRRWFAKAVIAFFLVQSFISLVVSIHLTVGLENGIFWIVTALVMMGIYRTLNSGVSKARAIFYALILAVLGLLLGLSVLTLTLPPLSASEWMQIGFTILASGLAVAGIFYMRKNRLRAYTLFKNSILIDVFFVQVFVFFEMQFYGLIGLAANILILLMLRYMISQEGAHEESPARSNGLRGLVSY
jgi:hypothetical protein